MCHLYLFVAYGGLPFPGIDCPLPDFGKFSFYVMFNIWATDITSVQLPTMLTPTDFFYCIEKRIELATMDLLSIIITYQTQDNQQEYFRLGVWFS